MNIIRLYSNFIGHLKVDFIDNTKGNEMYRLGGGFNKSRGFARIDLGSSGIRLTKPR